jgi:hypothetical protein
METSPKTVIFWCAVIALFELVTLYYGGIDALTASGATLFAIGLSYFSWKELKKEK